MNCSETSVFLRITQRNNRTLRATFMSFLLVIVCLRDTKEKCCEVAQGYVPVPSVCGLTVTCCHGGPLGPTSTERN
jgi:hypothetical protein